ncbi:MAG: hypothetical protein JXR97_16325 [Planctomycetes bacterium]|nr:hypothetical protein [Planctomycetota bacterium]
MGEQEGKNVNLRRAPFDMDFGVPAQKASPEPPLVSDDGASNEGGLNNPPSSGLPCFEDADRLHGELLRYGKQALYEVGYESFSGILGFLICLFVLFPTGLAWYFFGILTAVGTFVGMCVVCTYPFMIWPERHYGTKVGEIFFKSTTALRRDNEALFVVMVEKWMEDASFIVVGPDFKAAFNKSFVPLMKLTRAQKQSEFPEAEKQAAAFYENLTKKQKTESENEQVESETAESEPAVAVTETAADAAVPEETARGEGKGDRKRKKTANEEPWAPGKKIGPIAVLDFSTEIMGNGFTARFEPVKVTFADDHIRFNWQYMESTLLDGVRTLKADLTVPVSAYKVMWNLDNDEADLNNSDGLIGRGVGALLQGVTGMQSPGTVHRITLELHFQIPALSRVTNSRTANWTNGQEFTLGLPIGEWPSLRKKLVAWSDYHESKPEMECPGCGAGGVSVQTGNLSDDLLSIVKSVGDSCPKTTASCSACGKSFILDYKSGKWNVQRKS